MSYVARGCLVLGLLLSFAGQAWAHLLPKQNATINIVGNAAYCVVATPVSAYAGVDDDGSGLLSVVELQRHNSDIQRQFESRFRIRDGGRDGVSMFSWVSLSQTDGAADSDYVVILHRVDFDAAPKSPVVTTDLFGSRPGEQQMTITATRGLGKEAELAILSAHATSHQFYRGTLEIFGEFIRVGVAHILSGFDHMLFLLTILVGAAGWRYWLRAVTSFTVAHSITLTLAALDVVRLPAAIVEPAIAVSIVIVALVNLRTGAPQEIATGRSRIAVVFACGLLHGCGFASAIGSMGLDAGHRLATLAGFNIGIELGQFLFVGGFLLFLLSLAKTGRGRTWVERAPVYASAAACVLGSILFVQQLRLT